MMIRPFVLSISVLLGAPAWAESPPLRVLATVGMVADVAANVAGPCAEVQTLIGPGVDPHDYSATPSAVDAIAAADLILYVDRTLEERLADVLDRFRARTPTLGLARASFAPEALLDDPDAPGTMDPHLWMDVSRWARIAPVIAEAIAEQRPDCAADMAGRVAEYTGQLEALHGWVAEAIATIPEGQRLLVTAHDAFEYFADAYGIEASEAIEGISTASEASIGDIRAVAAFVVERGVPAVFVETTVSPRTVEALVAEVRSQGHEVRIGGELFSDAMGAAGTPEGSYIGMIRANTLTITEALGGQAPAWPAPLAAWAEAHGIDGP
ncbi:MAG: metal ABC transporter solute-binding protein, Zn/Mn family [Alkalilacustris sp.]